MNPEEIEYEALICPISTDHPINPDTLICLQCGAEVIAVDEETMNE